MRDCNLVSGMAQFLDPFGQTSRRQVARDAKMARQHQGVPGGRVFKLAHVPQRSTAELLEGASIKAHQIVLLVFFRFHSRIIQ